MKKMFNKAVLNGATVVGDGLTYPRIPNVYTGNNEGGYRRGDMMDVNAIVEMIKELTDTGEITIDELQNLINEEIQERVEGDQDQQRYTDQKIKDLIGTSPETLDTLKEIADALGEDPDFAANVWNKIAELTTKHNEDVQELQDAITSGFENIDFTPYVKKTDVVTDTTNGLMLASDKVKLDAFEEAEQYTKATNLPDSIISNADISSDANNVTLKYTKDNLIDGSSSEVNLQIPAATITTAGVLSAEDKFKISTLPKLVIGSASSNWEALVSIRRYESYINLTQRLYKIGEYSEKEVTKQIGPATSAEAGVMSSSDKRKLDSLISYQAGNGIDITGDTISCTLDTSLYSIVTELPETGLPNKIYLLPSTETKEGNIYTEYGYVDNKWEELGRYTPTVNLSPYRKALSLPDFIIGGENSSLINIGQEGENLYLSFRQKRLMNAITGTNKVTIPLVTDTTNGLISPSDKAKLDGIEEGAQVNVIESVSVNGTPLEVTDKGVDIPIYKIADPDNGGSELGNVELGMSIGGIPYTIDLSYRDFELINNSIRSYLKLHIDSDEDNLMTNNVYKGWTVSKSKIQSLIEDYISTIDTGVTGIKLAGYTSNEDINLDAVEGVVSIPLATPTTQGLMDVGDRTFIDNIGQKLVNKGWVQSDIGGQGPKISPTNKGYTGERPFSLQYVHSNVNGQGKVYEQTVDDIIPYATTEQGGMMAKADKTNLDSLVGKCIDWSDDNAGLLPIYNGDGSDGEWVYTHWIGAGQGTDNTWRKASDIILENITSDAILNNTPNATIAKAGLMSADDKSKLANPINYYYRNAGVDTKLTDSSTDNTCYIGSPVLEILGNKVEFKGAKVCTSNGTPYIDCSTSKAVASLLDGLMSKEDKTKLDSQPTIKASDATGVTDDDYVVIKKSELDSILSRLSALENKA